MILVALDSFKGCLSSAAAGAAVKEGLLNVCGSAAVRVLPVSDGGEGWLEAWQTMLEARGTRTAVERVELTVCGPMHRPVRAAYLKQGALAVIEVARACGLTLVPPAERNPLSATTWGVGQLLADAIHRGCRRFIIGLGGSATSDAGQGMLAALGLLPESSDNSFLSGDGGAPKHAFDVGLRYLQEEQTVLHQREVADTLHACPVLSSADIASLSFTIATDVTNPLCGPQGAAAVFGPQKGASEVMAQELDRRAAAFARGSAECMGCDCSCLPGAGAAGGLGYAFMQYLHADCVPGADFLLNAAGAAFHSPDYSCNPSPSCASFAHGTDEFLLNEADDSHFDETDVSLFDDADDTLLNGIDLVFTGEGSADRQTLMGKFPMRLLQRARRHDIPCILLAGRVADYEALLEAGFLEVLCINPPDLPLSEALRPEVASLNLRHTATDCLRRLRRC